MLNVDLDNSAVLQAIDENNFLGVLEKFPEQCAEAWRLGHDITLPKMQNIKQIVVTGLGGSAIGGDFLRVYLSKFSKIAVSVNRDYLMPGFVGPETLVFTVSYSGNTEETLSAYEDAKAKGAKIIALTSGGELAEKTLRDNLPCLQVPKGFQPRAATGYLFLPLLAVVEQLGLLEESVDMESLLNTLEQLRLKIAPSSPVAKNPAKSLAQKLFNKIPAIYGTSGVSEAVAMRYKGQINENAKAMAYYNILPELNHNEVVGTQFPQEFLNKLTIVFLRSTDDHPRVSKRFEITKDMLKDRIGEIIEVQAEGDTFLTRMFYLTYLGDVMSTYLAILYGVNPTPVDIISNLKAKLKE